MSKREAVYGKIPPTRKPYTWDELKGLMPSREGVMRRVALEAAVHFSPSTLAGGGAELVRKSCVLTARQLRGEAAMMRHLCLDPKMGSQYIARWGASVTPMQAVAIWEEAADYLEVT